MIFIVSNQLWCEKTSIIHITLKVYPNHIVRLVLRQCYFVSRYKQDSF